MLRTSRAIASLLRSLTLGTAATIATASLAVSVAGCKDESQPDYWVDKLEDKAWRARAITRLEQFYEDAITKANKDESAPEVQALVGKIVDPLTKTYVDNYDTLDTKTRVSCIKLLASLKDKRTEPALKKALEGFAAKPSTNKDDADLKWAARAAGDLKLDSLNEPLVQAFQKMKTSSMLGGITYRDLNEAMVKIKAKSWVQPLISMLEAEIVPPKGPKDKDKIDPYRDQLFWQTTSAQVLGELETPDAVEALMKVMLDPAKADVQATAVLALVKINKAATERAIKVLTGADEKLTTFNLRRIKEVSGAKEAPKDRPYVQTAALIIGTVGRAEGQAPLLEALKSEEKETNKAVIAREITKLPATPEVKDAFKAAFEGMSLETVIPPGANALSSLAEFTGQFYDPTMIDWLLERAEATKGGGEDKKALQGAITVTAIKLAKPDQMATVKAAVEKYGTKLEKDLFADAEGVVNACKEDVACYVKEMEKSANQDQKTQFKAIKAGYMVGILGNESTAGELVAAMSSFENAAVRFVAAQTIDRLLPKGSMELSEKLKAIVDKNAESGDKDKIAGDAPVKQVMYRIEARAH
ncbi:MAG: hypothetical protein R3B13_08095 [Polyangiaceae bacterium]